MFSEIFFAFRFILRLSAVSYEWTTNTRETKTCLFLSLQPSRFCWPKFHITQCCIFEWDNQGNMWHTFRVYIFLDSPSRFKRHNLEHGLFCVPNTSRNYGIRYVENRKNRCILAGWDISVSHLVFKNRDVMARYRELVRRVITKIN